MVLVSDDVFDLINMDEVYFAQCYAAKVSFQTDQVLCMEVSLHVVQLPGNELVGETFVLAVPNLLHKIVMD